MPYGGCVNPQNRKPKTSFYRLRAHKITSVLAEERGTSGSGVTGEPFRLSSSPGYDDAYPDGSAMQLARSQVLRSHVGTTIDYVRKYTAIIISYQ